VFIIAAVTATSALWWVWQGDLARAIPAIRWWWGG
jgi:hypothetical protein